MWTSTNFKLLKKKLQFFGQAKKTEISTLFVDDLVFINIIEALTNHLEDDHFFQSIICEGDGIYHCEFGNWLSIRKCGNYILFLTAFDKIIENPIEYFPPNWTLEKGAFYLTTNEFEKLKRLIPEIDRLERINEISNIELIWLLKTDLTHLFFGEFPNLTNLKREIIKTVVEYDNSIVKQLPLDEMCNLVEYNIESLINQKFNLLPIQNTDKLISFIQVNKPKVEWKGLVKRGEKFHLLLGNSFIINFE